MKGLRRLMVAALTATWLGGCASAGGGNSAVLVLDRDTGYVIHLANDQRPGDRALPLIGYFEGQLLAFGETVAIRLDVAEDGLVTVLIHLADSNQDFRLEGRVEPDRVLRASSSDFTIEGFFTGAVHPLDPNYQFTSGVHFTGQWTDSLSRLGAIDAWHQSWPPSYHYVYYYDDDHWYYDDDDDWYYDDDDDDDWWSDDDDDDWYYNDDGSSGGGSSGGGSSSGGSSGSGSGGSSGGGYVPPADPPSGGGDPTDDAIIFRRGQRP